MTRPKVLLFDIGGVCVVSPLQAIVDYERENGIPEDYINFAISRAAPNGAWQKLERGEIDMDQTFFEAFKRDLHDPKSWEDYHLRFKGRRGQKTLKQLAATKKTQLGDPISLKAETSDTLPTPDERGASKYSQSKPRSLKEAANKTMLGDPVSLKTETSDRSPLPDDSGAPQSTGSNSPKKSLKQVAERNVTQLGDPISLKAETSSTIPTPDERGAPQTAKPKRSFKDVANRTMLGDPVSLKAEKSEKSALPDDSGAPPVTPQHIPSLPSIDSTALFWDMMARSRTPDPHMFPALQTLRQSKDYIVAALSNTVIFPKDHEYSKEGTRDLQSQFDIFISSAEIGLRKPDPKVYHWTLEKLDKFDRSRGGDGVRANQVTFLDDIGTNLKTAKEVGMGTIKVNLGHVDDAVRELERITGLKLLVEKSRL